MMPASDRNLLLGELAVLNGFLTRETLAAALQACANNNGTTLRQVLLERQLLKAEELSTLEALAALHPHCPGTATSTAHKAEFAATLAPTLAPTGDHSQPALPPPGESRYRQLRPHAKGGLGEVFVALDSELNREVALKEIKAEHADNPDSRARFLLEAEVTGRLEHPGVVPVYGLGTYGDGRPYYAMRFIKGQSLQVAAERFHADEHLKADPGKRSLELRQLLGHFVAVCNAIAYAHSKGVLHRDLKPDNVMLGNYGETLVVDWGLAKAIGSSDSATIIGSVAIPPSGDSALTQAGSVLGTPQYMSPEQAAGRREELGPASDVYGLGATLYHLLTGKPPFSAGEVHIVLEKVSLGDFPPPRQIDPSVTPALEAICLKAMARRPQDRYASAKDLADDIEQWLADEPVTAYPEPLRLRLARWRRRHPALVTGTAALLFTVMAAGGVVTLLLSHEQGRTLQAERAKVKEQESRALAQVNALLNANPQAVPSILEGLEPYREQLRPRLLEERDRPEPAGATTAARRVWARKRTRAALALLAEDSSQRAFLSRRLLAEDVEPEEMLLIREILPVTPELAKGLWEEVDRRNGKDPGRFRALVALARFDPRSPRWSAVGRDAVGPLLASEPLHVGVWSAGLRGVKESLMGPMADAFRDHARPSEARLAAGVLRDYAAEQPELLADLLADADAQQFPLMLAALRHHGDRAVTLLEKLTTEQRRAGGAGSRRPPPTALVEKVEAALGLVAEDFALCQALPLSEFAPVSESLRKAGYRPTRFRPYAAAGDVPMVAAVWQHDDRDWQMEQGLTAARLREREAHWRQRGYVPVDLAGWRSGREVVYGALWVKRIAEEEAHLDLGTAKDEWQKKGYVPAAVQAVLTADGKVLHSRVWAPPAAAANNWDLEEGLKEEVYLEKLADLSRQPADVNFHFEKDGERRYCLVRQVSTTHEGTALHGLGLEEELRRGRELAGRGYRPVGLSVAVGADGRRLAAAVWQRPVVTEKERDRLGQRRANAAVALLHLGRPERVWPLLRQAPHPDARTYLLHRAGPLGADVGLLLRRLNVEEDASARQALILSLGEYTAEQLPAGRRKEWTRRLLDWYRNDPDPGVHAAIDWLLRQSQDGPQPRLLDWGLAKELEKIDAARAVRGQPKGEPGASATGGPRWSVNGQGQTMVLLGPGEFVMGSPLYEANRFVDELPHRRRIGRRFALASKKVTVAQFERFKKDHPEVKHTYTQRFSPDPDGPIISVTWYEAAQYCNWLSEQEGIPEDQWCYPPIAEIEQRKKDGKPLRLPADYLSRTGYRLPTEAEWEYACRAGAASSHFYGSSAKMLDRYAWYQHNVQDRTWPVGQKKPNAFGLFDMHGNTWDWCQEGYAPYRTGTGGRPAADEEDRRDVVDQLNRMLRGGSFYSQPTGVRSAFRLNYRPSGRVVFIGFGLRVARTVK